MQRSSLKVLRLRHIAANEHDTSAIILHVVSVTLPLGWWSWLYWHMWGEMKWQNNILRRKVWRDKGPCLLFPHHFLKISCYVLLNQQNFFFAYMKKCIIKIYNNLFSIVWKLYMFNFVINNWINICNLQFQLCYIFYVYLILNIFKIKKRTMM